MIYFIRAGNDGPIKIGVVKDDYALDQRLRTTQCYNHERLRIIGVMDGYFPEEREIHVRFDKIRKIGEWFFPSEELLLFIAEHRSSMGIGSDEKIEIINRRICKLFTSKMHNAAYPTALNKA